MMPGIIIKAVRTLKYSVSAMFKHSVFDTQTLVAAWWWPSRRNTKLFDFHKVYFSSIRIPAW